MGWRGVLIEPGKRWDALAVNRPGDALVKAVVCARGKSVQFVEGGAVGGAAEHMSAVHKANWYPRLLEPAPRKITTQNAGAAAEHRRCVPLADILAAVGARSRAEMNN